MTTPPDLSTELKAVNVLLAGMGETPVESLEAVQSGLAQTAINALEETSRSLQAKGWYWNSEEDYPLSPASDNYVYTPLNTIRVSRAYHSGGDQVVQRGDRIYNRTDRTYEFPQNETVKVDIVLFLSWDELPETAKQAVIYVAQRRLQMRELTSTAIDAAIEDDLQNAIATLQQHEDEQGPANIIRDSLDLSVRDAEIRRRR